MPPLGGSQLRWRFLRSKSSAELAPPIEPRLKMGSNLLFTCILLPFLGTISLFFIQETRRALDVALGFSLLTFLSSIFLCIFFTNDMSPIQYQFLTEIQ